MARAAVVVGNVVRRVMHAIREEDATLHLALAHAQGQGRGHTHSGHAAPDVGVRGGAGAVGGERWGEEGEGEGRGGGGALSAASVAGSNRSVLLAPSLHNLLDPALLPTTPPSSSAPLPPSARSSDGASAPSPAAAATAAAAGGLGSSGDRERRRSACGALGVKKLALGVKKLALGVKKLALGCLPLCVPGVSHQIDASTCRAIVCLLTPHSIHACLHVCMCAWSVHGCVRACMAERRLKHVVIERINDLLEEIDNHQSQLADQALEHIHQNEVILTMGFSDTLLLFLLEARKRRSFHVVVAEGAPCYGGHKLAAALAGRGVAVTVIADAGVFALMARVNLVLLAAHAVMANGGVLAPIGERMSDDSRGDRVGELWEGRGRGERCCSLDRKSHLTAPFSSLPH
ncbi:unnamed protein product [Closterium sp. NIES-54]